MKVTIKNASLDVYANTIREYQDTHKDCGSYLLIRMYPAETSCDYEVVEDRNEPYLEADFEEALARLYPNEEIDRDLFLFTCID